MLLRCPKSLCPRQPSNDGWDGGGGVIIAVARHHMLRTADIDVIGVRHEIEKFPDMRTLHVRGRCAAHKQNGDLNPARGLDQRRFKRTRSDPAARGPSKKRGFQCQRQLPSGGRRRFFFNPSLLFAHGRCGAVTRTKPFVGSTPFCCATRRSVANEWPS